MGFGNRFFFIEDDDRIVRIPTARYERIYDGQEKLPKYAGRRVRCAHVMVQLEDRQLTGLYQEWYYLLPFDGTGSVDRNEDLRGVGLVMETMPFPIPSIVGESRRENANVVDAQGKFAKRELDARFRWEPDVRLRIKILHLALGRKPADPPKASRTPVALVCHMRLDPASVARRWMQEVWADRNLDRFDELHDSDFVDRSPSGRGTDRAAYRAGIEELFRAFPDFQASTEDLVVNEVAGKVAVRWTAVGTHQVTFLEFPPTGRRVTFRGIEILRIERGRIVERWGEWDGLDLVQQLRSAGCTGFTREILGPAALRIDSITISCNNHLVDQPLIKKGSIQMNKSELAQLIAKDGALTQAQVTATIDAFASAIQKSLKKGEDITLVGFGTFKVVKRKARTGVNPQTKEKLKIPARKAVKFVAGKALKESV